MRKARAAVTPLSSIRRYGQLEINETDYRTNSDNTLAFGTGIDPTAVQVSVSGSAVVLTDGKVGDQVTLDNMASASFYGVQDVTFADGTTWDRSEILQLASAPPASSSEVVGTTGSDRLLGSTTGLTFDGKGGVDYAHGLGGGDTFVFDPGYGQLEVDEYDSLPSPTNTLAFGAGVSPSDVQASVSVECCDPDRRDHGRSDRRRQHGNQQQLRGARHHVRRRPRSGRAPDVAKMLVTGTTGNDSLDGISTGLTFDGKGGVDYAHGLGDGDTFVFDPGYGQLEVDEYDSLPSPTNTLAFGAGVSPSDVQASVSGNAVILNPTGPRAIGSPSTTWQSTAATGCKTSRSPTARSGRAPTSRRCW